MKKMNIKIITLLFFSFVNTQAQKILTQKEAIHLALENNYGIKIAKNNVNIGKNNSAILNSSYLPTITANGSINSSTDDIEADFSDGTSRSLTEAKSSRYNASIALNYILFDGLGREYNYRRLKEEYKLSELQARETIESTIIELFNVYYNVAQLKENVNSLHEILSISKERLSRAKTQFKYGQNTKLGILNAQVDINNDSINLINSLQQLKNSKRNLNLILGNVIDTEYEIDTQFNFSNYTDIQGMLAKVKQNNVSLLQSNKNLAIGKLNQKITNAGFFPVIGLNGSYSWNKNNNNPASFLSVSTNTGLAGGVSLTWNLFDGGTSLTKNKNVKINYENQKLKQKENILKIENTFKNTWDDYHNKYKIYLIQEKNIETSQKNFERTFEKFKIGQVNSIEFRQAQLNLLNTELSRNKAKYETKFAELQLLSLSGELLNVEF